MPQPPLVVGAMPKSTNRIKIAPRVLLAGRLNLNRIRAFSSRLDALRIFDRISDIRRTLLENLHDFFGNTPAVIEGTLEFPPSPLSELNLHDLTELVHDPICLSPREASERCFHAQTPWFPSASHSAHIFLLG